MKISNKLKNLGALALVLGLGLTITTSSFASQKNDSVDTITKEIDEIFSIERYIEYVESLDKLNDEEMAKFSKVQREIDKIYDEIDSIQSGKDNLTDDENKLIDEKYNQIYSLQESIVNLENKISPYSEDDYKPTSSSEDLLGDYLKYIDSLNILTDDEMKKYTEVEREIEKLYNSVEKINETENLTDEEEKALEKLYKKAEKLHESIYDIILKIEKAETNPSKSN